MFTGSQRKSQKAAAQTRNGVPPGKARHALITGLGQGLGSPERKKAAILDVATGLPAEQQKAAAQDIATGLPPQAQQDLATSLGQSLESAERQKAAAQDIATGLPPQAQQDLATSLGQSLESPERQKAAAQDIATGLPPQAQQDLATSFVKSLAPPQQTEVLETVFGPLDNETRKRILKVVIYTLTAVVFLFGAMTFMLLYQRKGADAPLTLATTALGAIVGLVAISPGGRRPG